MVGLACKGGAGMQRWGQHAKVGAGMYGRRVGHISGGQCMKVEASVQRWGLVCVGGGWGMSVRASDLAHKGRAGVHGRRAGHISGGSPHMGLHGSVLVGLIGVA